MVEERKNTQPKLNPDEVHLVASRCTPLLPSFLHISTFNSPYSLSVYRPNLRAKSDADIIRDAKLEAMGLNPEDHEHSSTHHHRSNHDRPQMATDEMVRRPRFVYRMVLIATL